VDNIIPLFAGVDYSTLVSDDSKDIEGKPKKSLEVCIQPFNSLFIHASGNVSACCTDYLEEITFGNVFNESLMNIWNGEKLNTFRAMHLKKMRKKHLQCQSCGYINYVNQEENIIDDQSEEILERMANALN
jgi:radical SAM protein with 4Fe4S-binding SPASM domain